MTYKMDDRVYYLEDHSLGTVIENQESPDYVSVRWDNDTKGEWDTDTCVGLIAPVAGNEHLFTSGPSA